MGMKIFIPEKYGMVPCPSCNSQGYIQNSERQPCPKCGGFGFIKKELEQNTNIFTGNKKLR
jgi:DnaJ-class molecular chaperone